MINNNFTPSTPNLFNFEISIFSKFKSQIFFNKQLFVFCKL
uniref:Uncharacterized protein n=1 Tax=viral metagenome TaxID=1070528 RepID=A0A6C0AF07_9ZZZZ